MEITSTADDKYKLTRHGIFNYVNLILTRKCLTIAIKTIQLSSYTTKHDEFIKVTFSSEIFYETDNIFAIRGNLFFKKSLAVTFPIFFYLKTLQRTESTDPLKVFDSFFVFVEPISYRRIFHLVSVSYITAHLIKY